MPRSDGSAALTLASVLCAAIAAGCSNSSSGASHTVDVRGGTYVDGSGLLGLAVLTTIRDPQGRGPDDSWSGSVSGPEGTVPVTLRYGASGPGSYVAAWWPETPAIAGTYALRIGGGDGGSPVETSFHVPDGEGLAPAIPVLSGDGTSLTWAAVPGAGSYECRVYGGTSLVSSQIVRELACDVGALPAGGYSASVIAYSADVVALSQSTAARPPLPDRFDVSEARLAFTRPGGATASVVLEAAGGAFHDGSVSTDRTFAVWVSIRNLDGSPTAVPWTIEIVGPALSAVSPVTFTYPANFRRLLVWSYEIPSASGSYGLSASSSLGSVGAPFTIGSPATLSAPGGIVASAGAQGTASVDWTPVAGASSYLVSAYHRATQGFVMSQWVAGAAAAFPTGTFAAGETYDVYVAATDADMVGGAKPTQVAITENTYQPASFVGR